MFTDYVLELQKWTAAVETTDRNAKQLDVNCGVESLLGWLAEIYDSGNTIYWVGNGGSAALAAHSALDYFRTAGFKSRAFNDGPLLTCIGNDFGYPHVFEKPLSVYAEEGDLLVAISSSGKSENILRAAEVARSKGCRIVTMSGFAGDNPLRRQGDLNFYVPGSRYGYVELIHGILCHSFLDLHMAAREAKSNG